MRRRDRQRAEADAELIHQAVTNVATDTAANLVAAVSRAAASPAEAILRKILTDPENGDQHYVDTDYGIIDVRVTFTPEEKEYLRGLRSTGEDGQ